MRNGGEDRKGKRLELKERRLKTYPICHPYRRQSVGCSHIGVEARAEETLLDGMHVLTTKKRKKEKKKRKVAVGRNACLSCGNSLSDRDLLDLIGAFSMVTYTVLSISL